MSIDEKHRLEEDMCHFPKNLGCTRPIGKVQLGYFLPVGGIMKREGWIGEFMGTFTLIFSSVCAASINGGNLAAALAGGFSVLAMAFTYQKVSGAHFNPALSLAMWISQKITLRALFQYVTIQTLAATAAAFVLRYFLGADVLKEKATVHYLPSVTCWQAFWMEVLLTFFVVETVFYAVVMGLAKSVAPIVLASLIIANTLGGSYLTGAAFNPARTLGTAIVALDFGGIWLHLIGPIVGSVASSLLFRLRRAYRLLPAEID